ncbi:LysR substrate-binding domain-containing protein [Paeniglutamicibacter cryotolerans]
MPVIGELAEHHPGVSIEVLEHEPEEALRLLAADEVALALTYDYNLAPHAVGTAVETRPLWSTPWGLGVRSEEAKALGGKDGAADAATIFTAFGKHHWIGNSRNIADETVLRIIASIAGFEPDMRHQSDSLDLVEELILARLGVGLLPMDRPACSVITILPLHHPDLRLRAYARTRSGHSGWPALALVLERLGRKA